MNLVFVGFMGCGKSTVGKAAAKELKLDFLDTDKLIEDSAELSISEIFQNFGEEVFRDMESEAVEAASERENAVIACGGGAVLRDKNLINLRKKGILIYLKTSPKCIYERIKNNFERPLLKNKNSLEQIEKMLAQREEKYKISDYIVETDGLSVQDIVKKILANDEIIKNFNRKGK